MEPVFKIIGDKVKEQSREEEPNKIDFYYKMIDDYDHSLMNAFDELGFEKAKEAYEQHLSSLRTYIASPELKERFGDNEFEEKDFEVREKPTGKVTPDRMALVTELVAYPVSQEQESQEDLWATLWSRAQFSAPDKFIKESGQDYTIKRRNTTP
jgi:hypothetical protein